MSRPGKPLGRNLLSLLTGHDLHLAPQRRAYECPHCDRSWNEQDIQYGLRTPEEAKAKLGACDRSGHKSYMTDRSDNAATCRKEK